jgi:hypothetical protein
MVIEQSRGKFIQCRFLEHLVGRRSTCTWILSFRQGIINPRDTPYIVSIYFDIRCISAPIVSVCYFPSDKDT